MRHACLDGVRLVSDRQPMRLRVDEHASGSPAIWLHPDGSSMAWIIVDIGERAWAQLAYQFGHELGHVLANSWQPHAKPSRPMDRGGAGGGVLAARSRAAGRRLGAGSAVRRDNAYGTAIAGYRDDTFQRSARGIEAVDGGSGLVCDHRGEIEMAALNRLRSSGIVDGAGGIKRVGVRGSAGRAEPLAGADRGADRRLL